MRSNSNAAGGAAVGLPTGAPRLKVGKASATALLMLVVVAVATRSYPVSAAVFALVLILAIRNLSVIIAAPKRERWLLVGTFALLTVTFPFALLRSETAFVHYFVALLSLLAAFLLTREPVSYWYASRAVLYASLATVGAYLLSSGVERLPLDRMIPDSSSNGVTSYLVILQANFCIANYLYRGKLPWLSPLLTLAICVVGFGRGSILSTVLIISLSLIAFALRKNALRFFIAAGLFAVVGAGVTVVYGDDIADFLDKNTKIGVGLYDPHRNAMITDYVARLEEDSLTILTGADYRGTVIESYYNMNPHNSYIRAHHIFGLPYLLLMLLFPLLANWGQPLRRRWFPFALLAVMLFRAATEPILFPTMLDIFFFSICFLIRMPFHDQSAGDSPSA
jgi:hypothetical protein